MLNCFTHFFIQNDRSAVLLAKAGIRNNITVSGDTRFDRVIEIARRIEPLPVIEDFCGINKVLVAGSTWEDDEEELIHYIKANPFIKFIIAPHQVDTINLKEVKKRFGQALFYSQLVEGQQKPGGEEGLQQIESHKTGDGNFRNVLIIDNVGMLSRLYRYASIAYVGGGFGADGVHNVLEAAVFGKPVIYGPEFEKYAEAVDLFNCGGGISINNALELEYILNDLWNNETLLATKGAEARNYVYSNAGATAKIITFVQEKRLLTN